MNTHTHTHIYFYKEREKEEVVTHPTPCINSRSNSPILHFRNKILHQIDVRTNSFGEHGTSPREKEFFSFFPQPILIRFLAVYPIIRHISEIKCKRTLLNAL